MLILRIWKEQPGKFFCISSKSRSGKWEDHFFKRSQVDGVRKFIDSNLDKDLYWCPHGFTKPRRLKEYAELPNLLWADLDEVNPSKVKLMPTVAWESSPGRFVGLWSIDKTVNEDLNRRLTYSIGADQGGWDLTQVLRIPGTVNYKYANTPRVKMLWEDGPTYHLDEIEKALPKDRIVEPKLTDALRIYQRYQKRLRPFARREILNGKPKKGKRSEVLWRLNNDCLEAGMTTDEAFVLLKSSPWNKFIGRRNGDEQLRRELTKAVKRKFESASVEHREDLHAQNDFLDRPLADVEEESIDWVWYPYLARRELTILEGDPGLGKSYLAQIVSACIVDGKKLPSTKIHKVVKGKVAYFDIENSAGTVTKRRLIDNGCINLSHFYQEEKIFMVDNDEILELVYQGLERVHPDLVVFDTLNTYIGKADIHKSSETQQAFANFLEMAKRFNCAVLVLRHLTKSPKERALYRGQGSIVFAGLARVVITLGIHPDEPETRVMAVTKLNVTKKPLALTFTIESLPDTLKHQDRSRFIWGDFVDLSSDDIIAMHPASQTDRSKEVGDFLREMLDDGSMKKTDVERAAEARGISMKIVRRVAKDLGVIQRSKGFGRSRISYWSLVTDSKDQEPEN